VKPDRVLLEMEDVFRGRSFPSVGPVVGQFLHLMCRAVGARRIFEMGSGFGYSAMWIAKAMPRDGLIVLTEGDAGNIKQALGYFEKAGLAGVAQFEQGDALKIFEKYPGPFDMIFVDIDKEDYPKAFRAAVPKLRVGGLLMADNVWWHGAVADAADQSADTRAIREFTRLIHETPGLVTSIFPVRDGVSVSLKL
ncbi:MAG: O-methyltransferase, partial [bacterium]